jgi:hypothetical protein
VVALFAFAAGYPTTGVLAAVLTVAFGGVGLAWLARTHRRVRAKERRWHEAHPEEPLEPPTS